MYVQYSDTRERDVVRSILSRGAMHATLVNSLLSLSGIGNNTRSSVCVALIRASNRIWESGEHEQTASVKRMMRD